MFGLLKRALGLRGSWKWACRAMDRGYIVRRSTDTGAAHYKLDHEDQRRIVWCFSREPDSLLWKEWKNANIFLSDFEYTNWIIYGEQNQ